jgi:hypothetical protein
MRSLLGPPPCLTFKEDGGRSVWWAHEALHRAALSQGGRWYSATAEAMAALQVSHNILSCGVHNPFDCYFKLQRKLEPAFLAVIWKHGSHLAAASSPDVASLARCVALCWRIAALAESRLLTILMRLQNEDVSDAAAAETVFDIALDDLVAHLNTTCAPNPAGVLTSSVSAPRIASTSSTDATAVTTQILTSWVTQEPPSATRSWFVQALKSLMWKVAHTPAAYEASWAAANDRCGLSLKI